MRETRIRTGPGIFWAAGYSKESERLRGQVELGVLASLSSLIDYVVARVVIVVPLDVQGYCGRRWRAL